MDSTVGLMSICMSMVDFSPGMSIMLCMADDSMEKKSDETEHERGIVADCGSICETGCCLPQVTEILV